MLSRGKRECSDPAGPTNLITHSKSYIYITGKYKMIPWGSVERSLIVKCDTL